MRILLADGDPHVHRAVAQALQGGDFQLLTAMDGLQALDRFREQAPDLVILDAALEGVSGLDLSRIVRLSSRKRFVPVLMFLDAPAPERRPALEAGVVEFIAKPLDPDELRCRVEALAMLVRLQDNLLETRARDEEELDLVKHVLSRLTGAANRSMPAGFYMETLQTKRINGDVCVYQEGIPGVHFGMICDATGHGLMAGISTLPVVEVFLAMVGRDLPLGTIYLEIHRKLKTLLPTGRFACLLLLRLDAAQGTLSVLNAGMPDALLLRTSGLVQAFPSQVLPAGISGVEPEVRLTETGVLPGDRLLACSDGLADATAPGALERDLLRMPSGTAHAEHCAIIQDQVARAAASAGYRDDVSWALWEVPPPSSVLQRWCPGGSRDGDAQLAPAFEASFTLDPRLRPCRELLPPVLSLLHGFGINQSQVQLFGMLLGEALTNAVDHGVLGLDSALKAQGFETFEARRRDALEALGEGSVRLTVTLQHEEGISPLVIRRIQARVEDPGKGFDWRSWLRPRQEGDLRPFGRGIALMNALARDLGFNESGNQVHFSLDCS